MAFSALGSFSQNRLWCIEEQDANNKVSLVSTALTQGVSVFALQSRTCYDGVERAGFLWAD
jgi:hypothetical protein